MQLHEMNLWQVMIFRLYILYNKHKMIKNGNQNREISKVLSQVLEYFFCRLYIAYLNDDLFKALAIILFKNALIELHVKIVKGIHH